MAIILVLSGCGGYPMGFPMQDCDLQTLEFYGTVQDTDGNPIAGAEVIVGSVGRTSCPNTTPLAEQSLFTDSTGRFYKEINIYQDDFFSWFVRHSGNQSYSFIGSHGLLPGNFEILYPDGVEIVLETSRAKEN